MSTNNRLSHSASSAYQDCAKKYQLRYKERLYSKTTSSALIFGSALDAAGERYLISGDKEHAVEEFVTNWTNAEIGGNVEFIPTCKVLRYSNSDLDLDLLTDEQVDHIIEIYKKEFNTREKMEETISSIISQKSAIGYELLSAHKKEIYNFVNWQCLLTKGKLMLDKFIEVVDENVEEVYGTQLKIELKNDEGDSVIGYIDFVVKWKGVDEPVVMDLKTSTRLYEPNAVQTSPQLSLYLNAVSDEYNDTRKAGYLVLHKIVKKNKKKICKSCGYDGSGGRHKTCNNEVDGSRCNGEWDIQTDLEITHQVLINDIPTNLEEMVLENFQEVNKGIKAEVFPRNFDACMKPWGKCDYYDVCHNKNYENVYKKEKK